VFSGFDDEEDYEEPERDTDYASRYLDDDIEDDIEEPDEPGLDWDDRDDTTEPTAWSETRDRDWRSDEESEADDDGEPDDFRQDEQDRETDADPPWEQDHDEYVEDDSKWPLALVVVGLLAVVLLAAGGYGVLQQRAAAEEEIRQLRAQLATATQPVEAPVDNAALAEARKRNVELSMAVESLKLENQRLVDTVAGLEAQLEAQQKVLAKPAPPPPKPTPAPAKPRPAPAAAPSESSSAGGSWFVNFGSYSQRAMADSWATKIKPTSGRAVVTTGTRDGKTFYRVRVIDLTDRAAAEKVARQLESQYSLGKLWVGR
jgi:cell division septation protein DedD